VAGASRGMMCLAGCGKAFHFGAVVSILDSHKRDPGSIPCNVTFCPNLEIVTQGTSATLTLPVTSTPFNHSSSLHQEYSSQSTVSPNPRVESVGHIPIQSSVSQPHCPVYALAYSIKPNQNINKDHDPGKRLPWGK
jgi:hypothetical protein